jgi:hypothetical protein
MNLYELGIALDAQQMMKNAFSGITRKDKLEEMTKEDLVKLVLQQDKELERAWADTPVNRVNGHK